MFHECTQQTSDIIQTNEIQFLISKIKAFPFDCQISK